MADTSQQALSEPHTNGAVDGLTEEEKSKMRPADIDADMREMERRKRVEMMMNSRIFREELERIIETQMKDGAGPSGLLQQISDMMGAQGARFNGNVFKNSNCVLPINDIRGVESMGYAKGEKLLRCKLAAVFRLLDLYGWTQGVGGQITARLNQDQEHFLVNPYGLLYHEVTASSLIKVDMQGAIVEQGTTNFGVHVAGFQLHSTIHAARPDIKCIIHITTPSVTAISSLKCGLLPIGQESIVIGEVSTHQYIGGSVEPEEREKIARNLGPINKIMLLTNRGALCCGETVEEAFFNVYNTVVACETQLKLMPAGVDNLNLISEESKKAIFEASRKPPSPQQQSTAVESSALAEKLEKRWRIGGAEFEALMRMLDNAGFRTGYIYRNPLVKGEPPRPRNDVEVPPAVSSLGYLLEEEELYKQGLWKGGRKGTDRSRWLNSPNVYQKVEILETGTPDPKKITKWVSDGSPTHSSTPVKIDGALQFVPKNTNPKEFKQIQQQIKDYRRADKISAGPQSHILEGVSWEEAKKMQDATISGTGEQVVLVGAASKGIIQRGFQHNAMVYKTPYAKNPFDAVTDQELDQYKREIERKQKGDPYDESQSESEALSSFNISRATHESSTAKSPIQSPVSVTSETEEESRDEPRVLRIETKQVPAPSQPEVVLSDVNDATTEFLNEMRRTIERQSDYKGDCELTSTYSSSGSERTRIDRRIERCFSEPLYDRLHLENVRITTIAERQKPVLITRSRSLVNNLGTKSQSIEEMLKSRYEARRKFFQDLEHQQVTTRSTESSSGAVGGDKDRGRCERKFTAEPGEGTCPRVAATHVLYDARPTSASPERSSEKPNDEETTRSSDVAVYSVNWKNLGQTSSVEVVNVKEENPDDVAASCTNGDGQVEEMERPESPIEGVVSAAKGSRASPGDNEETNVSTDSTLDENKGQRDAITTTMTSEEVRLPRICVQRFQEDNSNNDNEDNINNNDENLEPLNGSLVEHHSDKYPVGHNVCHNDNEDNINNNDENLEPLNGLLVEQHSDKYPVGHNVCHGDVDVTEDKGEGTSNEETSDNVALNKQGTRSCVKNSTRESDRSLDDKEVDTSESCRENFVETTDANIASSKTKTEDALIDISESSYYDHLETLVDLIDTNISSSRTELDALPNTDTCVKYNLDSTNMSLIYSLTPSMGVDQEENANDDANANDDDDTSQDIAERASDWQSDATKSNGSDALDDYIWIESMGADMISLDNYDREVSSDSEQAELEKHSVSSGSDILELPSRIFHELSDIDGNVFHSGINESTNEIIADLNASDETTRYESLQIVRNIVAEVVEGVYILSCWDSNICDLGVLRQVVRHLLDNYHYVSTDNCPDEASVSSDVPETSATAVNDNDDNTQIKGLGNSSPDFSRDDSFTEPEDPFSAVIEFCALGKRLSIVDGALKLNFCVDGDATNEATDDEEPDAPPLDDTENSVHVDPDLLTLDKNRNERNYNENIVMMRSDVEDCDQCSYCREQEDSMTKQGRLTPIDEDEEASCADDDTDSMKHNVDQDLPTTTGKNLNERNYRESAVVISSDNERGRDRCSYCREQEDSMTGRLSPIDEERDVAIFEGLADDCATLENSNDSSYCNLTIDESAGNPVRKIMSLDDTYTISDCSENDERNDRQERCDTWDSSVDIMSYSYDTKEFMRLEQAIVENSRLIDEQLGRNCN